jgi:hypothetical protein
MRTSLFIFLVLSTILPSCTESVEKSTVDVPTEVVDEEQFKPLNERAKRHVESILKIPATENYTMKIYRAQLDGDDKEDAIITVNRLEFAMEEASKQGNLAKRAELGFMGNYNYFFFFDGGLNKISPEIFIPSTPGKELSVTFENISSEAYKDVIIDFRVRNASYKDFYTINNHTPRRIFQWKHFDGLGSPKSEAYGFKYAEGSVGIQKDILIMKAELVQPEGEHDPMTFVPEVKESKEVLYTFFYNPQMAKYVTRRK